MKKFKCIHSFNSTIADFQKDLTFLCQKLVPTILYVSVSSAEPATMTNSLAALLQTLQAVDNYTNTFDLMKDFDPDIYQKLHEIMYI